MRSKDALMKKRVGVTVRGHYEWGREDHGRKKGEQESEMERTHSCRDWLRPALRHGSPGLRFHFCKVHNLKSKGLSWPLLIYANRQHPGCGPERPVGLKRRVGLIFWVLSLPREEPAIEFHGFKKGDPFSLQAGRNVTKELEELRLHYHKVPGALKVQEKRAWLTTSGAWGFIELVMKIIFAKYSKNIW